MVNKFIYRPNDCKTDAQLIEKLTRILHGLRKTTDYYHQHFGATPRQQMKYYEQQADALLNDLFTKPNNMDNNEKQNYLIVNTTHNTYLSVEPNTRKDYFQLDKAMAKKHPGKDYAQFVCDTIAEQYPSYNFKIEEAKENGK